MTITVATVAGLIIGIAIGAIIAGLVLMERPRRWVVCLRLPEELHRRLRVGSDGSYVQPQSGNHQSLAGELIK